MGKVELKLDWATYAAAKYACANWHYSKCMPVGKIVKIGVWENGKFIGCVLFSGGTCGHLGAKYGCDQTTCCELTRIALTKHCSSVSRIIKIALLLLKKLCPKMRLVVSFAAKQEGHYGGIYQANGWIYNGETSPKVEFEINGKRSTDRKLSQIVKNTNVKRRELERRGIIKELPTENKHRYLMPLDKEMKAQIEPLRKPYPKRDKQASSSFPDDSGGATPTVTLQKQAGNSNEKGKQ
jgi:hypothetical protein